jgi:TrmH family RNA methyltransferase
LSKRREAFVRSLARRRERKEHRAFVADGIRVVDEALAGPVQVTDLVVTPDAQPVVEQWQRAGRLTGIDIWLAEDDRFAKLVESSHPQGLLAILRIPHRTLGHIGAKGPILLLDRLQDPGNAGTLLRSLLAVGGRSVVALRGTVDLYSQKVVRASAGSLFHLDIVTDVSPHDVLPWLAEHALPLLAMDPRGESLFTAPPVPASFVLAIGNEAAGVSEELLRRADRRIAVPMQPPTESLNAGVAGSIALYEFWRASGMPPPPAPPPPAPERGGRGGI